MFRATLFFISLLQARFCLIQDVETRNRFQPTDETTPLLAPLYSFFCFVVNILIIILYSLFLHKDILRDYIEIEWICQMIAGQNLNTK